MLVRVEINNPMGGMVTATGLTLDQVAGAVSAALAQRRLRPQPGLNTTVSVIFMNAELGDDD